MQLSQLSLKHENLIRVSLNSIEQLGIGLHLRQVAEGSDGDTRRDAESSRKSPASALRGVFNLEPQTLGVATLRVGGLSCFFLCCEP